MTDVAHSFRRRMRPHFALALVLAVALPLALWAALPMGSSGATRQQQLNDLQQKIQVTQGKIGRKKGTERVLSQDIARWTARVNRLQGRIGGLQQRQYQNADEASGDIFGGVGVGADRAAEVGVASVAQRDLVSAPARHHHIG